MPDLLAVCPFGRGRQSDQHSGFEVLKEHAIRLCFSVMEFVHDHDVKLRWIELVNDPVQRLDRRKDVLPSHRPLRRDKSFAK